MSNLAIKHYNVLPYRGTSFPALINAPIFNAAAEALSKKLGVWKPLVDMSILSAAIPVVHGLIDVEIPGGGNSPTSGFIIINAPPGSGKTRAAEATQKWIKLFQQMQMDLHNEQLAEFRVKLLIWRKQRKAILDLVSGQTESSMEGDTNLVSQLAKQLEVQLLEHERNRPQPPRALRLLGEDVTIESLHVSLAEHPVFSIVSSEGGIIFKSRAINNLEQLNSLWSGSPVMINRKTGPSFHLTDARLSILSSVQPQVVANYLKAKGQDARDNGFTSRCMFFSMPDHLMPIARSIDSTGSDERHRAAIAQLEARMQQLLSLNKAYFDDPTLQRKVMKFTMEAQDVYEQLKYEIRVGMAPGGRFANVHDHANRLAEQVARVAAVLQYFDAPDSDISAGALWDAINICSYCSDCYLELFDPPPQEQLDAQMLNEWFNFNMRSVPNLRLVYKNHVRQFGPNSLRAKNKLNHALMVLQQHGAIGLFVWGKHHIIDLYPQVPIDANQIAYALGNPKK